jgi:CDP-2,3-bis-(O-geranylgeranyl)-sn-glycerol synthase
MDPTIINILTLSAYAIYFMLPAYLSNVSALVFGGGAPIDGGRKLKDGNRLFGNGKTWKGLIIGTLVGTVIGIIQGLGSIYIIQAFDTYSPLATYYYLILPNDALQGAVFGFCLGAGALIGDICGSFIKRRLNLERGKPAPLLDQLDFVIGALVLASIVFVIPFNLILLIIVLTIFLHIGTNIIAYLLGLKNVWY